MGYLVYTESRVFFSAKAQISKECNLFLKNKSPESRVKDSGRLCQEPATLPDIAELMLSKLRA